MPIACKRAARDPGTRRLGLRGTVERSTMSEDMHGNDLAGEAKAPDTTGAVIGIDIGGTSIKMGLVNPRGEVLATGTVRTGKLDNEEAFATVRDAVVSLAHDEGIDPGELPAIGLDVPGVVIDGKLAMAPNITLDMDGLLASLQAALPNTRFTALNDANAAALGETWVGAGNGASSLVMLTLGTGVGGGVVVDGRVVSGANGAAGEIGHLNVNPDESERCGCGCTGCLEQYASARGLIRLYREECARDGADEVPIAHATDALAVFEAAHGGNAQAVTSCHRLGAYLARALAAVAVTVDPSAFVIGGGMCGGWDTFGDECVEEYRRLVIPGCRETPIRVATLGNAAGFLGAARAALALV